MAQLAYTITAADAVHAYAYLEGKLLLLSYQNEVSPMAAAKQFQRIEGTKAERAEQLNAWCDMLTEKEWHRLRLAIRKRRQRKAGALSSITVSVKAHQLLAKLAKRDNVTLSQALEQFAAKALSARQSR